MKKLIITIVSILTLGSICNLCVNSNTISLVLVIVMNIIFFFTIYDITQTKHSLRRNYPIISLFRWIFESMRDEIRQYFIEDDLTGTPFSREQRSIVYQRSKKQIATIPFGTQQNVYKEGHEFTKHSIFVEKEVTGQRVMFGSKHCVNPYESSIMNISAMSYGSLSGAAIRALNKGAFKGGFYQNTGEGGISSHHLQGGDLVFQVGTGYFGAGVTNENGVRIFHDETFRLNSVLPTVKMIEVKLSQGAKPGHGGILPASKNTKEISEIRGVEPFTRVDSPPSHSAFSNFDEMVDFIQKLRNLSGGKPVGIKLCVGSESEVIDMIDTFKRRDNYPDFITVDGSEGGTGSAPREFTNNIGTPLMEGLTLVMRILRSRKLNKEIRVIASGKVIDTFDIVKLLSMGADTVNVARGFMFSLGCIQARKCNKDTCPVGIATQNKSLEKGLVVEEKYIRVYNYQTTTIDKVNEMVGSMGVKNISRLKRDMIFRRTSDGTVKSFKQIYGR